MPEQKWERVPLKEHGKPGSKRDAEKLLKEREVEVLQGRYIGPRQVLFSKLCSTWLESEAEPNLKAQSISMYDSFIRNHLVPFLGHMHADEIKPKDVRDFATAKIKEGLASSTTRHMLHLLKNGCFPPGLSEFRSFSRFFKEIDNFPLLRQSGKIINLLSHVFTTC